MAQQRNEVELTLSSTSRTETLPNGRTVTFNFKNGESQQEQKALIEEYIRENFTIQQRADTGRPVNIGEVSREGQAAQGSRQRAQSARNLSEVLKFGKGAVSPVTDLIPAAIGGPEENIWAGLGGLYEQNKADYQPKNVAGLDLNVLNPTENPVAETIGDVGKGLVQWQARPFTESIAGKSVLEAVSDPSTYLGLAQSMLPLIGPLAHDYQDDRERLGESEAAGRLFGNLLATIGAGNVTRGVGSSLPEVVKKPVATVVNRMAHATPAPRMVEANRWARDHGIPVSYGEHVGSYQYPSIRSLEHAAESGRGASRVAADFRLDQRVAMNREGRRLAREAEEAQVRSTRQMGLDEAELETAPVLDTPAGQVSAVEAFGSRGRQQVNRYNKLANEAYDSFRTLQSADAAASPTGGFMVNIADLKQKLRDIQTARGFRILTDTQRADNTALPIIRDILDSPDNVPLHTLDILQGDLATMIRGRGMRRSSTQMLDEPDLRLLREAYSASRRQVDEAAGRLNHVRTGRPKLDADGNPMRNAQGDEIEMTVTDLLEEGRRATRQKYAYAQLLEDVFGKKWADIDRLEPAKVWKRLIADRDGTATLLRRIMATDPKLMREASRGAIDAMVDAARDSTTQLWMHGGAASGMWSRLGPRTKRLLFPDEAHRSALDNFFTVAKNQAYAVNPSRTGTLLQGRDLIPMVKNYVIAKAMMTEEGVRWLTRGQAMRWSPSQQLTPAQQRPLAQWLAQGLRFSQSGRTTALAPGVAETDQEADPQEIDQEQGTR